MKANDPMTNEETAASLTGSARADALRALQVLAEAAENPDAGDADTPPLPDHLRDQWLETYGRATPASSRPAPSASREGWLSRLTGFFTKPRMAWASGLAAAAAVVVLMMQPPGPTGTPGTGGTPVVTRGGPAPVTSKTVAHLIVVAPEDKAGPLMRELARAFPSRTLKRVDAGPSGLEDNTIVIDTVYGALRRAGQDAMEIIEGDPLNHPADAITAIEALDEKDSR